MGKLVIFNLVEQFEQGFPIFLQIFTESDQFGDRTSTNLLVRQWIADANGKLPPLTELFTHYTNWRQSYRRHVSGRYATRMSVTGGTDTEILTEIKKASKRLKSSINDWLKPHPDFSDIRETLFKNLDKSEHIRVIFKTQNLKLQRLPWHLWDDFFKYFYRAEVALYLPVKSQTFSLRKQVKVLSVFGKRETLGNATIIEIDKDWEALKKLLSEDTNAALVRLVEPTLDELCDEIDQQRPQILFFAGHSRTEEEEEVGFIELNPHEPSITIDDLEPDLRKAVKRGLQLVIFNSCDGLGIARQLAALEIPNIIIMREPVPDEVAYKFLQRFLEVFAQGKPLHLAVRRAREKINRLENKFPGATWLPMTFQNPAEPPLTWSLLGGLTIGNSQGTEESQILWIPTQIGSSSNPLTEDTITCSSCQTQNPNDAKFCYKCGYNLNQQVLEITCINGHVNLGTNNFCIYCGVSLQLLETVITSPVTEILGEEIKPEVVICNNCGYENTSTDKFCLLCGSLISEDLENKQPQTIPATINFPDTQSIQTLLNNRYRIIQTLGTGGFSKTFFAEDTYKPSHPRCVIKQLRILTNYNAQAHRLILERFQREAAVLEELGDGCNQIPKLYAYFSEEGQFYLVQEFIEGQTLSEIVNQDGRLNEGAVKEILINTLPVLQYVHDKGIIHRDIKPDNIILRLSDRKPVLIDFGAVKEIISSEYIIEGSTIAIGTPGFSSPEQLMGRPTFASDLYSLGLTAIYLLTGERPQSFQTGETGDLMWKRNLPRLNSTFAEILDKTIKYNPQERYQSATEMLIALSSSTLNT